MQLPGLVLGALLALPAVAATTGGPSPTLLESRFDPSGTFYPGWAFKAHAPKGGLGYPAIPLDGYPTYAMAASTAAYFLGNDTGLNSAAENAAEARFGIVGVGWQISMRDARWRHLEKWEVATARAIKAISPGTKVLVSRNTEVGTVVWDSIRPLLDTPAHAMASGMWVVAEPQGRREDLCPQGSICNGSWGCPNCGYGNSSSVPYGKLWFNWTSTRFQDWWLSTHIGEAMAEPNIDGVYFDCCCGHAEGISLNNEAAFMAAAQAGFDRHFAVLAAKKKMTIAWNGEHVAKSTCDADMARLHAIYTHDDSQTFQLIYPNVRAQFNQTLAAFLLLRGKHALFQYGVIGPYECASESCGVHSGEGYGPYGWSPLLDRDYGQPTGPPTVVGSVWTRKWSKATISLDCADYRATFAFNG